MHSPRVRRLTPGDAAALRALRARSLVEEPFAFGSSPGDDVFDDSEWVTGVLEPHHDSAIFGAVAGSELVGMVGLARSTKPKVRHRAEVFGTFVSREHRGSGLGRELMGALVDHAEVTGVGRLALTVTEAMPAAVRLYRDAGFQEWGRETGYMVVEDQAVDAIHMGLGLAPAFGVGGPARLARATVLVRDLDASIEFYGRLGFRVLHDSGEPPARLVHVGFPGQEPVGLWLMAAGPEAAERVGDQTGGHPLLVLYVDNAAAEYERLGEVGVELGDPPDGAAESPHFMARDLVGNTLVFVQLAGGAA